MIKLLTKGWAKGIAGILATFFFAAAAACGACTLYLMENGYYVDSLEEIQDQGLRNRAEYYGATVYGLYKRDGEQPWLEEKEEFRYRLLDASGKELAGNYREGKDGGLFHSWEYQEARMDLGVDDAGVWPADAPFEATPKKGVMYYPSRMGVEMYAEEEDPETWSWRCRVPACTVEVYMNRAAALKTYEDDLKFSEAMYGMRAAFPASFAGSLLLTAACLAFLYAAAGRTGDGKEIRAGVLERIPFDVFTCLACLAAGLLINLSIELQWQAEESVRLAVMVFVVLCGWFIGLLYTLSIAVRLKRHEILKGWLSVRILRWCARQMGKAGHMAGVLLRGLPLYGKALAAYALLALAEGILLSACWYDMEVYVMFWMLGKILLALGLAYLILVLHKLQQGGKEIASGNMDYHVDTKYMFWDFEEFGECLNHIRDGLGRAVEDRIKSERFKTELITNVSHDIKTPLTSIISYVDLIKKEEMPTEALREYVEVLDRQSQRLKKLIEDLVEASKASTGNITVQLAECDVQVLLNQSMAEYQEKLEKAGLIPVLKQPDSPVHIRADGRHLWRIFDNLLNNICKYAMPGTRVYLDVTLLDGEARITFRNVSESPLQMDGETLLERFVRGDTSRHTEGSGLGLSIAASLAQLQHGRLELVTDGDLFKVVLVFPAVLPAAYPVKDWGEAAAR